MKKHITSLALLLALCAAGLHAQGLRPTDRAALRSLRQGDLPAGSVGPVELANDDFGAFTMSGGVAALDTADDLTPVAAAGSSVESFGELHKCVITITNASVDLVHVGDGEGVKVADFPEGIWAIDGVVCDMTVTCTTNWNADTNDAFYFAVGTVEAENAEEDLTGTEANLIAKQTLDTDSATVSNFTVQAYLAAGTIIDGSSTALDVWCNAAVENAANSAQNTIEFAGTITIWGKKLGDY